MILVAARTGATGAFGPLEDRMLDLIESTASSPIALLSGVLLAFGFGVFHAIGPGHGKTVTAAYVASTRTARRDAVLLGSAVALMHTFSALVLGMVLFAVASSGGFVAEAGAWLRVASGLLVLGVGLWLLGRRARFLRRAPGREPATVHAHAGAGGDRHHHDDRHRHDDDQHHHGLGVHTHADGTTHRHDVDLDQAMSARGLLLIGMSGGLLPSPSALLVLTVGLINDRTLYAMVLVAVFGLGIATTLTLLALATQELRVRAARLGGGRVTRLLQVVPVVGAVVLIIAGAVVSVSAMAGLADLR